jgi:hypothetical protein
MAISWREAQAQGAPRYFTGLPCKNGHVAERYAANKTCCECANATANSTKAKNRSKYTASSVAWGRAHPDKLAEYQRRRNKLRPDQRNLWTANYRSAKDSRQPNWLTNVDLLEMESVYAYCAALRKIGLDYHVDHIVPLRGRTVSGLHVPWNLQVIPGSLNMSKSNRFDAA